MKSLLYALSAALLSVLFLAADASAACRTSESPFVNTWRNDPNADLNDYSRIFMDADDPNCAEIAAYHLNEKVKNELNATIPNKPTKYTFQRWLDGYKVAVIFAAAHRLGANGWATPQLDYQMERLEGRFAHFVPSVGDDHPTGACGGDAVNTCMDDLVGTASGYAWMAAYQRRRTHRVPDAGAAKRALAEDFLRKAINPVTSSTDADHGICLRFTANMDAGDYGYPLCDANINDLLNGTAQTLTVNNTEQFIHYGFGLLTSVAVTKMGLEEAGSTFAFTYNEKRIIKALFEEAQRNIDASGAFKSTGCIKRDGTTGQLLKTADCGKGYHPAHYRLKPFYDYYITSAVGFPTAGTYNSNNPITSLYDLGEPNNPADPNPFFSYNRYVTYYILANQWVEWRINPNLQILTLMPYDNYNPDGFFEAINTTTGLAQGWACDKDQSKGSSKVDFFANGYFLMRATANSDSVQQDINNICGGGTLHRFWVTLPSWTKGMTIDAFAIDYTYVGNTYIGTRTW